MSIDITPFQSSTAAPANYAPRSAYARAVRAPAEVALRQLTEREMLAMEQVECPVIHRFGPGVYIREVLIPAGTFAIGHHQNFEHQNIMLKGRVTVQNEDGSTSELVAPTIFVGKPGRKVGYIHEDVVWLNVYATTETDIEKLEATLITKSGDWLGNQAAKQLDLLKNSVDAADYHRVLAEFGFSEEQARSMAHNETDLVDLPYGGYKVMVSDSRIEGKGLFATAGIVPGEVIAPARISGNRTIAGRYTNHSVAPNAEMVMRENGDIDLVASTSINGCHGGQRGDEITINYRGALALQLTKENCPCQQ